METATQTSVGSEEWLGLTQRVRTGAKFLTPTWVNGWLGAWVPGDGWSGPAQYVTATCPENGLVGLIPMATQAKFGLRFSSLGGYYMPFREPLFDVRFGSSAADACAKHLSSVPGSGFRMGPIERSSAAYRNLATAFRSQRWSTLEIPLGTLFYLDIPESREDYWSVVRGRAKKADYFRRRLDKRAAARIEHFHALDGEGWKPVIRDLIAVEQRSWVGQRGDPRFSGAVNNRFWESVCSGAEVANDLHVWLLYVDGTPSSFCLVLDSGSVRYQLVNGYANEVRKHSTGYILFKSMIEDALDRGCSRICFGQGDPGHKQEWGARPSEDLVDFIAIKPGLFGSISVGCYRLLHALRRR